MFYFWSAARHSHNADDIETPGTLQMPVADVVVDGSQQVVLLLVVYCLLRTDEILAAACLHLNKDDASVLLCDDVNITMTGMPVALQDDIAFLTQVGYCDFFSAFT